MRSVAAAVIPLEDDPVLAAIRRAPRDHEPESEEERRAVAAAKASARMRSHAEIEAVIEALRKGA